MDYLGGQARGAQLFNKNHPFLSGLEQVGFPYVALEFGFIFCPRCSGARCPMNSHRSGILKCWFFMIGETGPPLARPRTEPTKITRAIHMMSGIRSQRTKLRWKANSCDTSSALLPVRILRTPTRTQIIMLLSIISSPRISNIRRIQKFHRFNSNCWNT